MANIRESGTGSVPDLARHLTSKKISVRKQMEPYEVKILKSCFFFYSRNNNQSWSPLSENNSHGILLPKLYPGICCVRVYYELMKRQTLCLGSSSVREALHRKSRGHAFQSHSTLNFSGSPLLTAQVTFVIQMM